MNDLISATMSVARGPATVHDDLLDLKVICIGTVNNLFRIFYDNELDDDSKY